MTIAAVVLWVLAAVAALVCLAAGAMTFQLYGSDPAGNGLAQAYLVFTLGLGWLLVGVLLLVAGLRAPHPDVPADLRWGRIGFVTLVLFVVAVAGQIASLPTLFSGPERGLLRLLLQLGVAAVPLAFVLHAAWRALGVPLPAALATWGCAAVVVLGSVLAVVALAFAAEQRHAPGSSPLHRIPYPALLVQGTNAVHVVRAADDVRGLPDPVWAGVLLVIDANGRTASLSRRDAPPDDPDAAFVLDGRDESMDLPAVVALLLRIARLHADPQQDAEIRRLLPMQRDVTALTFVLTR